MTANQITDLFATLPRRLNPVSAAARLEGHAAAIESAPSMGRCAIRRAMTAFTTALLPCDRNCGFASQPAAELKSP